MIKVLLDNGHGENTPGKRSPKRADGSQLLEWQYAREIASEVYKRLIEKGVDCMLLVKENVDVPLAERVRRANEEAAKHGKSKTILVSVHCNAAGNGSAWMAARGWSVYIDPTASTNSKRLATTFANVAESVGMKVRKETNDRNYWVSGLYICKHTTCPAVLTENLFMDNEDDCRFLLSSEGKAAIVKLHVDSILKYIEQYA